MYEDREWMRVRFEDRRMTFAEIAAEAGCALRTAARWIHIHGIPVPSASERREQRGNTPRGERSPRWKGGRPRCACGEPRAYYANGCARCHDRSGANNPRWVGDAVGYAQAHRRVKALYGNAGRHPCVECAGPAAHWAYDHADPDERRDPDEGYYSLKIEHYRPMCVRCHKRFDMAQIRRRRQCGNTERP